MGSSLGSSLIFHERLLTSQTPCSRVPTLFSIAHARLDGRPFRDSPLQHDERVQLVRGTLRLVGVIGLP